MLVLIVLSVYLVLFISVCFFVNYVFVGVSRARNVSRDSRRKKFRFLWWVCFVCICVCGVDVFVFVCFF